MGWTQRPGTFKRSHDYENDKGWILFFEDAPPRWKLADKARTITLATNKSLTIDQDEEAQIWADLVIADHDERRKEDGFHWPPAGT